MEELGASTVEDAAVVVLCGFGVGVVIGGGRLLWMCVRRGEW